MATGRNKEDNHLQIRSTVLIFSLYVLLLNFSNANFIIVAILSLIISISLFFKESWIIYLIIFLLWTFGGLIVLFTSLFSIINLLTGGLVVIVGAVGLLVIAKNRIKKS